MERKKIILILCGHFEQSVIDKISVDISNFFGFPPEVKECPLNLAGFYSPTRRQYDANLLINALSELSSHDAIKTISLFRVDLFIPILTYIFGQSMLDGSTGIVSLYRLRNELYGLEPDNNLLIERFRKVIIHELGHAFGLIHCHNPACIMRSSTYVEDLDQKKMEFCIKCGIELDKKLDSCRI
ncbi:MAG: archaemetzincin family Zn-dependent metalloprotease [Bacteroidales bacterium]|nr:archaemetzincin family Zn-dependent metalloprotease [Bacteroidales bacterium]